jgi:hypothetical protein
MCIYLEHTDEGPYQVVVMADNMRIICGQYAVELRKSCGSNNVELIEPHHDPKPAQLNPSWNGFNRHVSSANCWEGLFIKALSEHDSSRSALFYTHPALHIFQRLFPSSMSSGTPVNIILGTHTVRTSFSCDCSVLIRWR